MDRVAHIFVLLVYVIPFMAVFNPAFIFEWLFVASILVAYACGAFAAGGLVARRGHVSREQFLVVPAWKLSGVVIVYLLVRYPLIGQVLSHLLSGTYAHWAQSNAFARYSGEAVVGLRDKLASVLLVTYGFLLGGASGRRPWKFWIFYALMITIETSGLARSGVLLSLSAFFVEYVIRNNRKLGLISFMAYLPKVGAASIFLVFVFSFSAIMRVYDESEIISIISTKVSSYTIAIYQALLIWMGGEDGFWGGYGQNSFASVYKIFGYEVKQGFYDPVLTSFGYTNIFTSIRGLLSDFGVVGAAMFYFMAGVVVAFYAKAPMGKFRYLGVRFVLFFLFFPLYSPFIFTSVLLAFCLSALIILLPATNTRESHARSIL